MQVKKVALVTGASSGIGAATAVQLAQHGFAVVLAATTEEKLHQVAATIRDQGGEACVIPTDLQDDAQTVALFEKTLETYGRLDVLVNNAGACTSAPLEYLNRDEIRQVFEVNIIAPMQLSARAIPLMRKQKEGRIINISSATSNIPAPLTAPYAASKAGVNAASDSLRLEVNPWNIQHSVIVPGFVDTPIYDKARLEGETLRNDSNNPYYRLMNALNDFSIQQVKTASQPEDIAKLIVQAATAEKPKAYYYGDAGTKIFSALIRSVNAKTKDWLLDKLYGLKKHHS